MLIPKKMNFKKMHRRDSKPKQKRYVGLIRNGFGLKSLSCFRLTSSQLESARRTMIKKMNRTGNLLLRVFPNLAITQKPSEVRMGKGKGLVSYWCYPIKIGEILFEIHGISQNLAKEVSRLGNSKLPVRTKLITIKRLY